MQHAMHQNRDLAGNHSHVLSNWILDDFLRIPPAVEILSSVHQNMLHLQNQNIGYAAKVTVNIGQLKV